MPSSEDGPARAVLLHGLGRSARSMRPVARALGRRNYRILNIGYPSRTADIATLAADVAERIDRWESPAPLDFVTHSLGGILLRVAVARGDVPLSRIRRVVMFGPPNQGSELADIFPTLPVVGRLYEWMTGPAGRELGTSTGVTAELPAVPFELGVIAGNRSMNPVLSAVLREPNDGKVRVSSTRVDGMRDFLVIPQWHPFLMVGPRAIAQAMHFLDFGCFRR